MCARNGLDQPRLQPNQSTHHTYLRLEDPLNATTTRGPRRRIRQCASVASSEMNFSMENPWGGMFILPNLCGTAATSRSKWHKHTVQRWKSDQKQVHW